MFEYERSLPLGFKEFSIIRKDGYTVRDVYYLSPLGGRIPAYLVVPNKEGQSFPAVVFLHPGQGNRATFLSEAEDLASKGIISLLIDAPSMRKAPPQDLSQEQELTLIVEGVVNIQGYIQTVVDLRRGIDLLSSFEYVDSDRLVYVGHSLGATWGGVLAGVDERIKAYVLMAGFSSVSKWHKTSEHPLAVLIRNMLSGEQFNKFITELEPLDAVHYIKKLHLHHCSFNLVVMTNLSQKTKRKHITRLQVHRKKLLGMKLTIFLQRAILLIESECNGLWDN
ncbi:alpha/beta hydrolase [Cytobacillus praedii]|uniref:alpha/beta hydrolase n=1 Tax=Cytobacillus praedii TaxID=1742358 RepID=UPI003AF92088